LADGALLQIESPHGAYTLHADWLVVADGARSPTRRALGLDIDGQVFQDRFLIADVLLDGEPYPLERTERRFWFKPSFFDGESALMHREADGVWRIDLQLGWQADPEAEKQPERVAPRIRRLLNQQGWAHIGFTLEWVSVYTFQCRRMAKFRHGRLLFAGDSAHQVSPFGARGANSGVQDADNLVWKLQQVIAGHAPEGLLDSYDAERGGAADENLLNSTRSTEFMTPKSAAARALRDAVLGLAGTVPGVRALVNSGRLSVPSCYRGSPLNTPDAEPFDGRMEPGAPLDDAPVSGSRSWLLQHLGHGAFTLLHFGVPDVATAAALQQRPAGVQLLCVLPRDEACALPHVVDVQGLAARRCDARPGTVYLLRPDQHVAARWRAFSAEALHRAWRRALAMDAHAEAAA
jgi:3-(3-hydroxy-phenyl)propionate hydroxylase